MVIKDLSSLLFVLIYLGLIKKQAQYLGFFLIGSIDGFHNQGAVCLASPAQITPRFSDHNVRCELTPVLAKCCKFSIANSSSDA